MIINGYGKFAGIGNYVGLGAESALSTMASGSMTTAPTPAPVLAPDPAPAPDPREPEEQAAPAEVVAAPIYTTAPTTIEAMQATSNQAAPPPSVPGQPTQPFFTRVPETPPKPEAVTPREAEAPIEEVSRPVERPVLTPPEAAQLTYQAGMPDLSFYRFHPSQPVRAVVPAAQMPCPTGTVKGKYPGTCIPVDIGSLSTAQKLAAAQAVYSSVPPKIDPTNPPFLKAAPELKRVAINGFGAELPPRVPIQPDATPTPIQEPGMGLMTFALLGVGVFFIFNKVL